MSAGSARIGDYVLGRKLGTGQFSKVKIATKEGIDYAAKIMVKTNDLMMNKTYLDLVFNEAKTMSQLDHPNIVKLIDFSDKGEYLKKSGKTVPILYLIFELITGGEIFDYIALGGRFSEKIARHYFAQLISALEFLHLKGYAHRDIKAENVLMDESFKMKLADFGFSAPMAGKDGSGKMNTYKGTPGYMAPELLMGQPYQGDKVDLFAAGVLLFIMIAQHPPFRQASPKDGYYRMFCQQNENFWVKMQTGKPPGTFSADFKSLINSLIAFTPGNRLSLDQIKSHPFMQGPYPTEAEVQEEFLIRRSKVEVEWKAKLEEALAKKRAKEKEASRKKAMYGAAGTMPHHAVKSMKGGLEEQKIKTEPPLYCPKKHDMALLFSVYDPTELMNELRNSLNLLDYFIDPSKETEYRTVGKGEFEDGFECTFEASIEKVDNDVHCIRFAKLAGEKWDFFDIFNKVKQDLAEQGVVLIS